MAPRPPRDSGGQPSDGASTGGDVRSLAAAAGGGSRPDPAEHDRLLAAAASGDRQASDELLRAHLDWVRDAARRRAGHGLEEADLFQEGALGLSEAIAVFAGGSPDLTPDLAPDLDEDFEQYARAHVSRRMDQALAGEESSRREGEELVRAAEDYERVEFQLRRLHGRPASESEIAAKLEWTRTRTEAIGKLVADARRRHDEELLPFLDRQEEAGGDAEPPDGGRRDRDRRGRPDEGGLGAGGTR